MIELSDLPRYDLFILSPHLDDAVFSLPVGQVSQPVVSERGVHIMRVDAADGETREDGIKKDEDVQPGETLVVRRRLF